MSHRLPLYASILAIAAMASTACAANGDHHERVTRVDRNELVNTGGWELSAAAGAEGAAAVRAPGIAFVAHFTREDVTIEGECNQLRGTYTATGKRMRFDIAIATRRSCTDDKNLADRMLVELLNREFKAEFVTSTPIRLRLSGDTGESLEFQARPMQL